MRAHQIEEAGVGSLWRKKPFHDGGNTYAKDSRPLLAARSRVKRLQQLTTLIDGINLIDAERAARLADGIEEDFLEVGHGDAASSFAGGLGEERFLAEEVAHL